VDRRAEQADGRFPEQHPERKKINERLTKLWNYEKFGVPYREGGRYFFSKNTGLQNQSVLYAAQQLPGDAKALLDPNTLSKDGTTALSGDGRSQRRQAHCLRPGDGGVGLAGVEGARDREREGSRGLGEVVKFSALRGTVTARASTTAAMMSPRKIS
jgi:hypothetical protein